MAAAVVVGGGIAGLAFALAHARAGNLVTVLERDPAAPPSDIHDVFEAWSRPGTPQARLLHQFLPRARRELLTHAPEVYERLVDVGAVERDLRAFLPDGATDADGDLRALYVRRPVLEAVLRSAVHELPDVVVRAGLPGSELVIEDHSGAPVARGVVAEGAPIEARHRAAVAEDRARRVHWGAVDDRPADERHQQELVFALSRLARSDGVAARALLRRNGLLELPDHPWRDADLLRRAESYASGRSFDPTRHAPGPTRSEVVDLIEGVSGGGR